MRKVDVVLGLQWGDEGKGKVVDVLTPRYGVVARFQGGPNAGHSLLFDGREYVLNTVPSGVFREGTVNIIGNGVVIDPRTLAKEIKALEADGMDMVSRLFLSKKAHLIMPTHRALDAMQEAAKGEAKIGSTLKGIGPAYMSKTGREGLRVGDIVSPKFKEKYNALKHKHLEVLGSFKFDLQEDEWMEGVEYLRRFGLIDSEWVVNDYVAQDVAVLAEGAQGSLLDIDFGTYPFVTSSNTVCAGVCTGLGVAPGRIGEVYGIFKAYCTRVGGGPFPTELHDETGRKLREIGKEFGAVTGRERRCGWLDMVALKYSVMLNGATGLIMMKSDVLNTFDTIKVAVDYDLPEGQSGRFPFDVEGAKPVYREFKGWKTDICNVRKYEDFPREFKEYVEFIEAECGVPVKVISVGPDRDETIIKNL
jgi:adenylosuccinate synthase